MGSIYKALLLIQLLAVSWLFSAINLVVCEDDLSYEPSILIFGGL
ncbi:hypothetical protein [Okeania sp.]|nr:hypothetical protein [Okeania sp.]